MMPSEHRIASFVHACIHDDEYDNFCGKHLLVGYLVALCMDNGAYAGPAESVLHVLAW